MPAEGAAEPKAAGEGEPKAEGEGEPKPRSHAVRNITLIVGGLLVAIVAGFLIGKNGQETPSGQVSATQAVATPSPAPPPTSPSAAPTPSPHPSPSPQPSPSPRASPSPSPTSTKLVDIQGSGEGTSDPFNAPHEWKLTYSFECPNGGTPGLAVDLYQGDTMVKELVNDARSSGDSTTLVNLGGSDLHLVIRTTDCSWHIKATT